MSLYSKRKEGLESPPSGLRYDLPQEFRNQVWHIWNDSIGYVQNVTRSILGDRFGLEDQDQTCKWYAKINRLLCDEWGVLGFPGSSPCDALFRAFSTAETDKALDVIEASFIGIAAAQQDRDFQIYVRPRIQATDAVKKLNQRFQEHAIGYRLDHGQIIRLDSEYLHTETTEQAFRLLLQHGFEGALAEFQLAHKQYRDGPEHYDDSLTNCLKSLESTLKTICNRRNWTYGAGDTVSKLLDLVFARKLIPGYLQSHFTSLRATLESGLPTIRNREGGHGSGEKPNDVPEYLAAYQLHLTASAIVFLIRANESFSRPKP